VRYRLAVLTLFAVLPLMNVLNATPAPEPYAVLDIGPPPKGWSIDKHRNWEIEHLAFPHGIVLMVWSDPEIRKLPSIAALKDPRYWLSKNLCITWQGEGNRLRLMFRGGSRAEQAAILNSLLRINLRLEAERIKFHEEILRKDEACILDLVKRIESGRQPGMVEDYEKGIDNLRSIHIPARRAEIARLKQIAVIRWAK
jgi:hypothetical protein